MQKTTVAAIYARSALPNSSAISQQLDLARDYVRRAGWKLSDVSIFVDDGSSGAHINKRSALMKLLSDLEHFDVVVVRDLTRISRNPFDVNEVLRTFHSMDKCLFSLADNSVIEMQPIGPSKLAELMEAIAACESQKQRTRALFESTSNHRSQDTK